MSPELERLLEAFYNLENLFAGRAGPLLRAISGFVGSRFKPKSDLKSGYANAGFDEPLSGVPASKRQTTHHAAQSLNH